MKIVSLVPQPRLSDTLASRHFGHWTGFRCGWTLPALALMLCLAVPPTRLPAQQPMPPRYRLEVGHELVYQLTASEDFGDGERKENKTAVPQEQWEWRVTVGRRNDDGSWRLYIRLKEALFNRDGSERLKRDSFGYCDLRADGSYSLDEETAIFKMLLPYELFCRLPDTSAEFDGEWSYQPPVMGNHIRFTYRIAKADGPRLKIAAIENNDRSAGRYQTTRSYEFDRERGLATEMVQEFKDPATEQVQTRRTIRLVSETRHDGAWAARFDREARAYLAANTDWINRCHEGIRAHTVEACREARSKARAALVAGRERAEMPYFQDLYDANIEAHDKEEDAHLRVAKDRERFFAAVPDFSRDWETGRFDGGTFKLAEHRGEVLVLYFWSTGCEYCMLAAPQISELAAEYNGKGKGVAVLGMILRFGQDGEAEVAKHASSKAYRGIPHVDGKDVAASYHFQQYGFYATPTTVVLDQTGKIAEIFGGYSGDLGQRIREVVNKLLSAADVRKGN